MISRHGNKPVKNFSQARKINQLQRRVDQTTRQQARLNERSLYKTGMSAVNLRKSRTRTLIQLGGLVEKTNLLEPLGLTLGDDLQKDETLFDQVAILAGALSDIYPLLKNDREQKILWKEKGKKLLAQ
eukprot:TRINITY_DN19_c0_g1_i3.p1 TRINITY_DN19_c0_g1~~TRINITY_DN19_c0_g1_i3.p1  ORF type:complete len:128 (-),score=11.89 TRINITY_DN19_c0_g1_i3:242-625(-)